MGSIEAPVKVIVIGGSYGGLSAALNLYDLCNGKRARTTLWKKEEYIPTPAVPIEIKILDERDGWYHTIGSPLALASESYAKKIWMSFAEMPALKTLGLKWVQGKASKVDTQKQTVTIQDTISGKHYEEGYDYLVVSSGLKRQWPTVPQSLTRKEYLEETGKHIQAVRAAKDGVVVIGGGAVGIEMAAELKLVEPTLKITLIHSREKLLSNEPLPDDFKDKSAELLQEGGVQIILNDRVTETVPIDSEDGMPRYRLTLQHGSHLIAGQVIWAISRSIPSTSFLPASALDSEGYIKVNSNMNFSTDSPTPRSHFACGDLTLWPGIKRGGGAMAQGHVCAANIHSLILQDRFGAEAKLLEYPVYPPSMGLAVGKVAVVYSQETGTTWGEEDMKMMFRDDLGFAICWEYLQLNTEWAPPEKSTV